VYREPLCLSRVLPSIACCLAAHQRELPPLHSSYGLMSQTKTLLLPSVVPIAPGLCRLLSVPAGSWPFPMLSPYSLYGCLDPYPAASPRCIYPLLPGKYQPHSLWEEFGTPDTRHNATSMTRTISRLQSFLYVQAPILASPPDCTHRKRLKSLRRPGRLHHAMLMGLPTMNCGIATCLNRAIDMAGLPPAGIWPFRPLHSQNRT